jgi:Xaa-Pro aminopeptidase
VSEGERVSRLARELRSRGLDRLLVTAPVNVRYLTGFTGSNGLALIAAGPGEGAPGRGRAHLFLTDFRYATQSAEQISPLFECEIASTDLLEGVQRVLDAELEPQPDSRWTLKLGFDDAAVTVKQHARLRELLGSAWELVACGGVVEQSREVKDEREIARIRAAAQLADEALAGLLEAGLVGRSERELAIELELRMRRLGASSASFPSIVAAGAHGALPHAEPRDEPIARDVLVTIDWGCTLDGYCSDCTRTYSTGEISSEARDVYELVRHAQQTALEQVRPGPTGREIDAVARLLIEEAGHGDHFGHGLGHGVGMEVHEGPRLSRTAGEHPLRAGNVVTVEPGVYLPGRLGVRIEDLVALTADGHETLTGLPKELTVID